MPSLNKVLLMGNLTRDPELRVTPKGTPICQFSLAINRQFKMESGESREEVIYVDVEAWGKQGEIISKYCTEGSPAVRRRPTAARPMGRQEHEGEAQPHEGRARKLPVPR